MAPIWRRWRQGLLLLVPLLFFIPLLLSVMELHHNSAVVEDRTEVTRPRRQSSKPDHLVLGPAAGQGLPDRLQCRGLKALNTTYSSVSSQVSQTMDLTSFVTVFAFYNSSLPTDTSAISSRVTVGKVSYDKTERAMAILDTFIGFIQVSMPKSNVIILTDPASKFSIKRKRTMVVPIEGDYSREKLMLQRIKSYMAFLKIKLDEHLQHHKQLSHYIFTDSDIAVVDDLGHIFHDFPHFHLALTFRNNKEQPLNSGFIAVRGSPDGILKAIIFLQEVLEVYVSRYMRASRMLGDQLALAWVVKSQKLFDPKNFGKSKVFLQEIHGASVLFLPCSVYNWTPPEGAGQFHGMPLDVKVVHFKGSRKRLMLESWSFFNSSIANLPDMLCLILMSGRTKYDF